uniref:Uncharacterized protein n=1 Tax=Myotis myotis TaxID=51298 RepID=A0A7J7VIH8_MYOMY|nr:hypothetical protein mMyoMyo1_008379 [Myotis myotis]
MTLLSLSFLLLAACFGGRWEEEAVREVSIVFWKPASELGVAKAVSQCQCLWAVPGRHLKGDIPTWEFLSLERAGLLLWGESDRTSFSAFRPAGGPCPWRFWSSRSAQYHAGPRRRPRRPLPCSPARKSLPSGVCPGQAPAPASAEGLGQLRGQRAVQAAGPPRELDKPQGCPSPRGGPERFPDWDISASWHRRPTFHGRWPRGTGLPGRGPRHRGTYHVPGLHHRTFQTSSPLSSLERRIQTGFQLSPFRGGNQGTEWLLVLPVNRTARQEVTVGAQAARPCRPPPPPRGSDLPGEQGAVAQGLGAVPSPPLGGKFCSCWA